MPLLEEILTGLAGAGVGYLQGRSARKQKEQQAETAAQQLQEREKQALYRAILGDENVAASAKNQLLAAIMPEFRQQTEVTKTVPGVQATAKPVTIGQTEFPTATPINRLGMAPTAQMIAREAAERDKFSTTTPVGLPVAPHGSINSEVTLRSGPGSREIETVMTPMQVFQDKPVVAEKKTLDPVLTEAGQTIFKLYQEGKVPEAAVREFLPSYQEAVRTGDFSKLKLPSALTQTADAADENKLKKIQLDLQNRGLDIQRKTLDLEQKRLDKEAPFRMGDKGTELTLKLSDRATKQTEDYQAVIDNYANMTAVLDRMRTNPGELNRIVTDQAVINSFNKILDPKSVVREGEYQRTEDNQALLKKAGGWLAKIFRAGTTLTESDLNEIQETAAAMSELRRQIANKKLEKLRNLGKARGLDPDEFAPLMEQNTSTAPTTVSPAPKTGANRYKDFIRNQLK